MSEDTKSLLTLIGLILGAVAFWVGVVVCMVKTYPWEDEA